MDFTHLFERDLNKLIEEINLYKNENDLWTIKEGISNSAGNLALHIIGNLNYFVGTALFHTNYLREREKEFSLKDIPRERLVGDIKAISEVIRKTLHKLSDKDLKKDFPFEMNDKIVSIENRMVDLLTHLNYHLGQVNYHRRMINGTINYTYNA